MQRRFQQLNEYTFITSPIVSEDDDEDEDNSGEKRDVQSGNPQDKMNDNGMTNNSDGENNGGIGDGDDGNGRQDSEEDGQDMDFGDSDGMDDDSDGMNDNITETSPMEDDDEVIDVDELTSAQEKSEIKIDGVNDKLTRLLGVIIKFQTALDQNSRKIEDLKAELEKRNPTPTEKLNLRSLDSYPYNVTPQEYWSKDIAHKDNYMVNANNDIDTSKENKIFRITDNDIKGGNDREIYKSMDYKLDDFIDL